MADAHDMYTNPFVYKRPLVPGQDDLIMIQRSSLLLKTISGLEFGHWYSVCGGKKIGKTSFLLTLADECRKRNLGYRFIMVKPEDLASPNPAELYRVLCHRIGELVSGADSGLAETMSPSPDLETLKQFLAAVSVRLDPTSKVVIILDNFEILPRDLAQEVFRTLINLRQSQALQQSLAKFQFILSGAQNPLDMQIEHGHSLSEYTMRALLEDFRCDGIEEMLFRVSEHMSLYCQPGFGRLLYEATGGTGYLIQKVCYRVLERAFLRKEQPEFTLKNAEMAIGSIVKEGETNVEMIITQIEKNSQLIESLVRTLRAGTINASKYDPHLKALVALGALSEHNGSYRVRNRIYETVFQDYFTSERLADLYFEQQEYQRAKELVAETSARQADAKNALSALLGNINFVNDEVGERAIVKRILEAFMNVLDSTTCCSLMMLDEDGGTLRILDAIGMSQEDIRSFELQVGQGVAGWVAQVGRPRTIRDVTDEIECPDFAYRDMAVKLNMGAMASLPLKVSNTVLGVINLCLGRPREFSDSEVKMLEVMAAYASLVLQNARLQNERERYQQHVERVRNLVREARHQTNPEAIFDDILSTAGDIVGTNKPYLVYRKHNSGDWLFRFSGDFPPDGATLPRVEKGEGIAGHVLSSGLPCIIEDPRNDERYFPIWPAVQWELAVPCIPDDEPQGCIVVACDRTPGFSPAQMQLLTLLADAVAITLRNKWLYGIAEKKTQEVITAHGIGEALSQENSLQAILKLIADESLNVVGRDSKVSFVWIKDHERKKLMLRAAGGEALGQEHVGKSRSVNETSIVTWVLNAGSPFLAKDVRQTPQYRPTDPAIQSEIAVPLFFRDEVIGVIDVQSLELDDFDEQDQEALIAVAHNAAVATKIGELCDVRLKELEILYRSGTKITSNLRLKNVLQTIAEEGLSVLSKPSRNIAVYLLDPESLAPAVVVTRGPHTRRGTDAGVPFPDNSREAWVINHKQHYLIGSATEDPLYRPPDSRIQAAVFVPIVYDDRVTGMIVMESHTEDDFGEHELRLLWGLAHQAGVAIENARLSEGLDMANIAVSKSLEMAAIGQAVAGLAHDIKNIATTIAGETEWLSKREREGKLNPKEIRTAVKNLRSYVKKMEDYANDLKNRKYNLPPALKRVGLADIIDDAIHLIAAKATRQRVRIQNEARSTGVHLYADPGRLARAFLNIMANSVEAMPEGGLLKIAASENENQVRIEFSDTGVGIPQEHLRKVVTPLFSTKDGFGLGLSITKHIIEADHGGSLVVDSKEGQGANILISLPRYN